MPLILPSGPGCASGAPDPVTAAGARGPAWAAAARRSGPAGQEDEREQGAEPGDARAHRQHDVEAVGERGAHRDEQGRRVQLGRHPTPAATLVRTTAAAVAGSPPRSSWLR